MVVGICAIIKDCPAHNLNEWLEWHRLIGVDHFFIYDNDSAQPLSTIIEDLTNVIIVPFPGKVQQIPAYKNCISRHKSGNIPKCDWIAFIDDDEFIVIEEELIKPFLEKQTGSGIALNWITFGADGDVAKQEPQITRFTMHTKLSNEVNLHIKSIVRPECVLSWSNPHFCTYKSGMCLDVLGNVIDGSFTKKAVHKIAWINHYYSKSLEEYTTKIRKGRVDSIRGYTFAMFHMVNRDSTEQSTKIMTIRNTLKFKDVVNMRNEEGVRALEHLIYRLQKTHDTKNMTMIEIGSYSGQSTVVFAKYFKKVITIDPFIEDYDPADPTCKMAKMSVVYEKFKETVKPFSNIIHLKMMSDEAAALIEEKIGFVYIDGCHTYEQVKKDIQNYLPLIDKDSYIGGHDYIDYGWLGIKRAVNEVLGIPEYTYLEGSWLWKITKETKEIKSIALITPTGGRPEQFKKCVQWMKNQTYTGRVFWIIVDDCEPTTTGVDTSEFKDNWLIIKKFPKPVWRNGDNTQARNLKAGISFIKQLQVFLIDIDAIFIIEDDDYYKPQYLTEMVKRLQNYSVAGETQTVYYNIPAQGGHRHKNDRHSSLFQTAFTPNMIPVFEKSCASKFIDIDFFKNATNVNLFEGFDLSVGIKGQAGRAGIGYGHGNGQKYPRDIQFKWLTELIGEDIKYYYPEYDGSEN